jgi:hypothetical protein
VASCTHGKQKRSTTRKEKTEEAESLAAKTLVDPHLGSLFGLYVGVGLGARTFASVGRASACLVLIFAGIAEIKGKQAEARPIGARVGVLDLVSQLP